MTANMFGMDISAVRQLAGQFAARAQEIDTLSQQLTQALESTTWQGPDATKFREDWRSQHLTALRQVVEALRQAQQHAMVNAQQQEDASNA